MSFNRALQGLLAVTLSFSPMAWSHDLGSMEKHMSEAEPYTQVMNQPAPGFSLQDPDGKPVSLADFRGKPVVLYFLYARCRDECPLHSLKIKQVQDQVAEAGLNDQIQFVAIATDIEDAAATAELMRHHPKHYGLVTSSWTYLYGGPGREKAGMELAKTYTLEFTPVGDSVQLHGVVTHLIDPEGQMRARYHGLDFDTVSLISYAAALLHGEHGEAQSESAQVQLSVTDWLLSAVGLLSLALLLWAGWSYFNSKGARRDNVTSADT